MIRDPISSLRRTAKNSPFLFISILVHTILLVLLGLVVVRHATKPPTEEKMIAIVPHRDVEPPPVVPEPPPIVERNLIPPDAKVEIVDTDIPAVLLDKPAPPDVDLTKDMGDPNSNDLIADSGPPSSSAIGVGTGGQRGWGPTTRWNPPGGLEVRVPKGGRPFGPTKQIDQAVRHGLLWLCRHQNPDGSWSPKSMKDRCDSRNPCFDPKLAANDHYDVGLTSLAVLCFLGAGFDHRSEADLVDPVRGQRHRVGEVVKKGLEWLKSHQNPDGSFSAERPFLYNEALATMALSEAFGLSGARYWRDPAQHGVEFLVRAQRPNPSGKGAWGWRYASRTEVEDRARATSDAEYAKTLYDSDTSVTTWCVMALKSAQLCGLSIDKDSLAGAVEYCRFATAADGLVGYLDAKSAGGIVSGPYDSAFTYHPTTMSALGMCIRIFTTHDPSDPFLELAAKRLVADKPTVTKDRTSIDYYYWYYGSLALNQLDGPDSPRKNSGKYWKPWNEAMVEAVLSLQDSTDRACTNGGWIASDRWGSASGAGPLYSTAMNVLTLEVYYRYPNAFGGKRS
jgi:hypothetical protein